MTAAAPEFSRPVALARLGAGPFRQKIAASKAERRALAMRFDLVALDRLTAVVELQSRAPDQVLLHAAFEAEFVQTCVVTLEPVGGALSDSFTLRYGPAGAEGEDGVGLEDEAFEPLAADFIDIGEAVAQEFSLALPPFPRCPEAGLGAELPPSDAAGPFAALARLAERQAR
jgi:uncharacterized metal-binding protein YceD (DUF177 family)